MKNHIALGLAILLAGCAQMFPARYVELAPGKYKLEASGNMLASVPSLLEKIDSKAEKLCGAGKFFYKDDGDFSTPRSPAYINGVDIGASYQVVTREVVCH
ncbi:hypothetical protein [Stutzerimonas zhaodongensis]|uniref:hypothetical protein n=1 Tax=Stutzerimonas TaxID=2901164 RepID=UPI00388E8A3C